MIPGDSPRVDEMPLRSASRRFGGAQGRGGRQSPRAPGNRTLPARCYQKEKRVAAERRFSNKNIVMLFADVRRAYCNAKVTRYIFIRLPKEDPRSSEPGICVKLKLSLYATRDAAQNYEK